MFKPIALAITRYQNQIRERQTLSKMIQKAKNARRNARLVNIITK